MRKWDINDVEVRKINEEMQKCADLELRPEPGAHENCKAQIASLFKADIRLEVMKNPVR
jgi:hypothetical protein